MGASEPGGAMGVVVGYANVTEFKREAGLTWRNAAKPALVRSMNMERQL